MCILLEIYNIFYKIILQKEKEKGIFEQDPTSNNQDTKIQKKEELVKLYFNEINLKFRTTE